LWTFGSVPTCRQTRTTTCFALARIRVVQPSLRLLTGKTFPRRDSRRRLSHQMIHSPRRDGTVGGRLTERGSTLPSASHRCGELDATLVGELRMKFSSLAALAVIVGSFAQTNKPAPKRKAEIQEVKATGCTVQAAVAGCLLLKTLDGKTTYNIFTEDPTPATGIVIIIDGKPHSGATTCKQGIALDVTRWESTGEKCLR